jgi:hypothetical protein
VTILIVTIKIVSIKEAGSGVSSGLINESQKIFRRIMQTKTIKEN